MNKKASVLFLVSMLLLVVTGCAFWDGFTRGLSGTSGEVILGTAGEVAGETVKNSVPLLPSPWREIVVGCLAGVTGWLASARKRKVR
ncbi:MAG: hypothetical protein ABGY10_01980 [bacterium]